MRKIQLAMETGEGPDILAYGLVNDMEAYVDSGYLECLDDVIKNPSQYVEAALDANRIDDKLYAIPFEFNLSYAAYDREEVRNRTSWTLSELMEAVENSDAEILEKNLGWYWLVMRYGLFDDSQKDFIDWEKRESHLNEQPFLDFLAFAKNMRIVTTWKEKLLRKARHILWILVIWQDPMHILTEKLRSWDIQEKRAMAFM